MTDERMMEIINEQPVTQRQNRELLKIVYSLLYIVDKAINPSEELQKESLKYSTNLIDAVLSKSLQDYKETHKGDMDLYDTFDKLFKL